ncbi:MAG: hypothetical protein K2H68_05490 [Bacteroidales bacterium]|nr:hypothetical protein [Bacteroidales bacterium]
MKQKQAIQLFERREVRTVWDEEHEKWYFSVVDVVAVLTDSVNPTDYFKKLRKRDSELSSFVGTNCPQISMIGHTGKRRMTLVADTEQLFRIIQSIPSPKAEPFKLWMAQVASDRLDQIEDPELSIQQAMTDYKRLGYSEQWINQRLKSIEVRKELTDEWQRRGIEGQHYATLTDIITQEWSGFTTKDYKKFKGLKKESLRDNMTNIELALNTLAEAATTEISAQQQSCGLERSKHIAKSGGSVAKAARKRLENQLGRSVISPANAKQLLAEKKTARLNGDADK